MKLGQEMFESVKRCALALGMLLLSATATFSQSLVPCPPGPYGSGEQYNPVSSKCYLGRVLPRKACICPPGPDGVATSRWYMKRTSAGSQRCYAGRVCNAGLQGCLVGSSIQCLKTCGAGKALTPYTRCLPEAGAIATGGLGNLGNGNNHIGTSRCPRGHRLFTGKKSKKQICCAPNHVAIESPIVSWKPDGQQRLVCVRSGRADRARQPVFQVLSGVDRPGSDYANFTAANQNQCEAACSKQQRCRAWTFVNAGYQGPKGRCWLKHRVPRKVRHRCCTSGVKQ